MKKFPKKSRKKLFLLIAIELAIIIGIVVWLNNNQSTNRTAQNAQNQVESTKQPEVETGKILSADPVVNFTAAQTAALIKQTNRAFDLPVPVGISKQTISYTSSDGQKSDIPIYARVYFPQGLAAKDAPVMAFATGTTGIGDECAPSLEQPAKRNWANYDSLMAAYASQGYIVIVTDYEGMRDIARLHHYMVGDLEGRAMLDSVHALYNLPSVRSNIDKDAIFLSGYSQGGHAAFWADAIAKNYAPDISIKGVVGFGPVTSVSETLTDAITANANINWFGPFVLTSYQDWYKRNYPIDKIILPQWARTMEADAARLCIDTVNKHWPNNTGINRSASLYTPEFIDAVKTNTAATNRNYAKFFSDMNANIVGTVKTNSPKLINQGQFDNVVLPRQNQAAVTRFCGTGNRLLYREYTTSPYAVQTYNPTGQVDHYQTMNASMRDTLTWMNERITGVAMTTSCR